MKKIIKEIFKLILIWIITAIAGGGSLIYLCSKSDREFPMVYGSLFVAAFATIVVAFAIIKKVLPQIKEKISLLIKCNFISNIVSLLLVTVVMFLFSAFLIKMVSILSSEFISWRTLSLMSGMISVGGSIAIHALEAMKKMDDFMDEECYVGPVRGNIVFFLKRVDTEPDKTEAPLVMCPITLWNIFEKARKESVNGLPEESAMRMACKGIEVFANTEKYSIVDRLFSVINAGSFINSILNENDRNYILSIYRRCCNLNEDEAISLTDEEIKFLNPYMMEKNNTSI